MAIDKAELRNTQPTGEPEVDPTALSSDWSEFDGADPAFTKAYAADLNDIAPEEGATLSDNPQESPLKSVRDWDAEADEAERRLAALDTPLTEDEIGDDVRQWLADARATRNPLAAPEMAEELTKVEQDQLDQADKAGRLGHAVALPISVIKKVQEKVEAQSEPEAELTPVTDPFTQLDHVSTEANSNSNVDVQVQRAHEKAQNILDRYRVSMPAGESITLTDGRKISIDAVINYKDQYNDPEEVQFTVSMVGPDGDISRRGMSLPELRNLSMQKRRTAAPELSASTSVELEPSEEARLVNELELVHQKVLQGWGDTGSKGLKRIGAKDRLEAAQQEEKEVLAKLGYASYTEFMVSGRAAGMNGARPRSIQIEAKKADSATPIPPKSRENADSLKIAIPERKSRIRHAARGLSNVISRNIFKASSEITAAVQKSRETNSYHSKIKVGKTALGGARPATVKSSYTAPVITAEDLGII